MGSTTQGCSEQFLSIIRAQAPVLLWRFTSDFDEQPSLRTTCAEKIYCSGWSIATVVLIITSAPLPTGEENPVRVSGKETLLWVNLRVLVTTGTFVLGKTSQAKENGCKKKCCILFVCMLLDYTWKGLEKFTLPILYNW